MRALQLDQDCCGYLFVLLCVTGALSLRIISLDVPTVILLGDDVWMNCTIDLESDELYSIKLYKDDVEFYRYLPRDLPSGQKFDLPGVFVDLNVSLAGHVYLRDTNFQTEGTYRCEASAESPSFQTDECEKNVKVYVLPEEGPKIQGSQPRYEVGDHVNVTCKSSPSRPAAALKWYVNEKEAGSEFEIPYPTSVHDNGLQTTSLGLLFEVKPEHLFGGVMKLRCTAIVSQSYSMTSEEFIIGEKSKELQATSVTATQNGPIITGDRARYRVGDQLDIKCSSSKSNPAPELHWFLNDEKVGNEHVIRYPIIRHSDGQETSSLGLRLRVEDRHFDVYDEMVLKCTATHSKVINMRSDEKTVAGNHRSSGLHVSENVGKVTSRNGYDSSQRHHLCTFLLLFIVALL